ncbi:MAG: PLD nuclease N-terminal domain-containing protein [Propionibacteriaceae bacterium]|jgi:hypothetical protein|nr:PLD nuclease N-terminal domain-containing protein [Propionibacteriaceae bacterium]
MGRILPLIILLALIIYTAVHVASSDASKVRGLPKPVWFLAVIVLPIIGMFGWWVFGRPLPVSPPPMKAPDDDPDFLRGL